MLLEPVALYQHSEFRIKFASSAWEQREARRLRHSVFCVEQGLFANSGGNGGGNGDDSDEIDAGAIPIVALACLAGMPEQVAGTVRIDERSPRIWYGSRLAIHPAFRGHGRLAAALIRLSVCSAAARGCDQFRAFVQVQNVRLFRRLHWETLREVDIHGRRHHEMLADLNAYPPFADGECGFVTRG